MGRTIEEKREARKSSRLKWRTAHPEYYKAYAKRPEAKAQQASYQKIYRQRPEVKERARIYAQKPENKKRARSLYQTRIQLPGVREQRNLRNRILYRKPGVKEKREAYRKVYCENPEMKARRAAAQRLRFYGLSREAYESMLSGQGGVCAVCKSDHWGPKGPMVDHDHEIGHVRGIVCESCNRMLGGARDCPAILRLGIDYLRRANLWLEKDIPDKLSQMSTRRVQPESLEKEGQYVN